MEESRKRGGNPECKVREAKVLDPLSSSQPGTLPDGRLLIALLFHVYGSDKKSNLLRQTKHCLSSLATIPPQGSPPHLDGGLLHSLRRV